jgi:hypothetical protein
MDVRVEAAHDRLADEITLLRFDAARTDAA